jgi:hypothetical protein
MRTFMGEVEAKCLRTEFIARGANVEEFKNHMRVTQELHESRRPLLITELAPADWSAEVLEHSKWSQASVLAAGASSALYDLDGNQTALGKFYASVSQRTTLPVTNGSKYRGSQFSLQISPPRTC